MSKLAIKLKREGQSRNDPDSDFDRVQLDVGTKIEMEHIDDKETAKEIAKDHLVEDPNYYKKLSAMEAKSMKKSVLLAKAKFPVGTIRKFGQSFYKKAPNMKWNRVPTKQGRAAFEKQEAKGKIGVKRKKSVTTKKPAKSGAKTKKIPSQIGVKTKTAYNTYQKKKTPASKKKYIKEVAKVSVKKPVVLKNKTQQYIDKIKKIQIMSKEGKKNYMGLIKEAIANKDEKGLNMIFKDVDNWLLRNKKFKTQKNIRRTR